MSVPVGDARNRFSELLDSVERTHERITVTRHGKAVAVMISPDDLESLEETMGLLATPGAVEEIQEGLDEVAAGDLADWQALTEQYQTRD